LNVKNRDKLLQALNNIWIGDYHVWAREARFDRFEKFVEGERSDRRGGRGIGKVVEAKPVVITHGVGVKNVRVASATVEDRVSEGEKIVKVGEVDVKVGKKKKKNKSKNKIKKEKKDEDEGVVGKEEKVVVLEENLVWEPKVKKGVERDFEQPVDGGMLLYTSNPEDRVWVDGGLVARVILGDSSLSLE